MVPPAGNVSPAPTPAPPAPLNAPAPAPNPPAPSANSSLPPAGLNNASPDDGAAPYKPSVDLAQSGSHIGTRVIQPTGESLSPKVDMGNLIANEEAKDTMTGPVAAVQTPPDSSPPTTPAEVQVNSTDAINLDSLPASPAGDPATFPNQSQ
jgi:hypothetical protein